MPPPRPRSSPAAALLGGAAPLLSWLRQRQHLPRISALFPMAFCRRWSLHSHPSGGTTGCLPWHQPSLNPLVTCSLPCGLGLCGDVQLPNCAQQSSQIPICILFGFFVLFRVTMMSSSDSVQPLAKPYPHFCFFSQCGGLCCPSLASPKPPCSLTPLKCETCI